MPIPTAFDRHLGEIDDLQAVVMIRLRTMQRAGARYDPESVREPLDRYVEAVRAAGGDRMKQPHREFLSAPSSLIPSRYPAPLFLSEYAC